MAKTKEATLGNLLNSVLGVVNAAMDTKDHLIEQTKSFGNKARIMGEKIYDDVAHFNNPKPDTTSKNFLAGALVGLLIGASSAAVLTPRTGKQLRKKLSEKYQDAADKTHEIVDYLSNQAAKTKRKVKRNAVVAKKKINSASRSAKKTVKKATAASKTVKRAVKKATTASKSIKRAVKKAVRKRA